MAGMESVEGVKDHPREVLAMVEELEEKPRPLEEGRIERPAEDDEP